MDSKIQYVTLSNCADVLKSESKSDMFISFFNFTFSHFFWILISVIVVTVLYGIYKSFWSQIYDYKEVTDIGFDHIKPGPDRLAKIRRTQNARQLGTKIPPPYPNGWFAVMESTDLGITEVVPVNLLGQHLCVYRGKDGIPRCLDAYCPDLGVNLVISGTVSGNCIQCISLKWKFGEDGISVSVPGVEHAPRGVSMKTWPIAEADGSIWIWHDAEGREPQWEMRDQPELKNWGYRGRNEFLISAHIQDITENTADMAHLNVVHHSSLLSDLGDKYPRLFKIIGHYFWSGKWFRNDDHTAVMELYQTYKFLKTDLFNVDTKATLIGPGHVRMLLQTVVGPILIIQSLTPLEPLVQKITHRVYSPSYNALIAFFITKAEGSVVKHDVVIWNSKKFVSAPAYVRTDKTIREYRSWYSQFYSEKSTSFRDAVQKPLDWQT